MNKNTKQTNLSYLAGYIDGDGCFFISKVANKNRTSHKFPQAIIITSVNKEVLIWAKQLYGGSIATQYNVYNGHKPLHHYSLRKLRAIPLTNEIRPYLVEKMSEAEIFISFSTSKSIKSKEELISRMKILKDTFNLASNQHRAEFEPFKNTIEPTELDFAYLAGFIDAECCLCISRYFPKDKPNCTYKILLQCNNTKSPVFKWLLQRFGGHINFIDRQKYGNRNQLCWRLSGKALSKILNKIYPFLKYKKPVCEQLIKFYSTTILNGGARHTEVFRSQYSEILKVREEIVAKVHELNSKGI